MPAITQKKSVLIRLDNKDLGKLNYLVETYHANKTKVLKELINKEYIENKKKKENTNNIELPSVALGFPTGETFRRVDMYSDDFDEKLSKQMKVK